MKKIFAIAAMAIACLTANAQQEAGTFTLQPKVGLTVGTTTAEKAKCRCGLTAGVEGMYQINNWFGLSVGVNYSQYGSKAKLDNTDWTCKYDYITIPVLANFYVCHNLALKTGVECAINTKKDLNISDGNSSIQGSTEDLAIAAKSTLFSIPVGISYEFDCGIVLDGRCNIGVTDVYKGGDARQVTGMFTVGYKFAL